MLWLAGSVSAFLFLFMLSLGVLLPCGLAFWTVWRHLFTHTCPLHTHHFLATHLHTHTPLPAFAGKGDYSAGFPNAAQQNGMGALRFILQAAADAKEKHASPAAVH